MHCMNSDVDGLVSRFGLVNFHRSIRSATSATAVLYDPAAGMCLLPHKCLLRQPNMGGEWQKAHDGLAHAPKGVG